MRKSLFIAALLLSPLAQADDCRNHYTVAHALMEHRQEGVMSVVDMMEIADQQPDPEFREAMKTIIRLAYEYPQYSSPEYQRKAVKEFANEIYLRCQP